MKLRAILALCATVAGLVLLAPTAEAVAYPPTVCATISISTTTPQPGESITVSGVNFLPNANVRLELRDPTQVLKTVKTDAGGSFSTTVTMPTGLTGRHALVAATGAPAGAGTCPADPLQFLQPAGPPGNGGANGGGTAFTGLDVLLLILAAAGLLGLGVALNRGGKRRRHYAGEF